MAKHRDSREGRDQAGVGPDERSIRHLHPLSEMKDVKISKGEPDIRGWEVYTSAGRDLGEVADLLVDPTIGQVVLLDIDLDDSDRRALAPIRAAWIDREHKRVVLDRAQISDDELLPSISRADTTDEDLRRFGDRYADAYGDRGWDEDADWHLRHGEDELRFNRQRDDRDEAAAEESRAYRIERHRREMARAEAEAYREDAEREREDRDALDRLREVRYSDEALRAERPQVVEETVVRRRVVDPDELNEPPR